MARTNRQAPAQATTTVAAPSLNVAAMSAAQRAELLASLKATAKADKASARGNVEAVAFADNDPMLLQVDVRLGAAPGTTSDGRAYLVQADAIEFTANGKRWKLGAVYATEVVAK